MKKFHIIILIVMTFSLLISGCSQSEPEMSSTIEESPTKTVEPTSTPSPEPPTVTPIPPTPTPEPSPTVINLKALEMDFETFLVSGEQPTGTIALAEDNTINNQSPDVIQVAEIANLLAYFEEVEAEISLTDCEQNGDYLTCTASESNQWIEEGNPNLNLKPLTYEEFAFSTDPEGNVEEISLLLSGESEEMLAVWIESNKSWLGNSEFSQSIFTADDQLIYSGESGQQISDMLETVQANNEEYLDLLQKAEEKFQAGAYEEAASIYEEMSKMSTPDDLLYGALVLHADANDKLGNHQEAIDSYLKAVEIDSSDAAILNNLCWDLGLTEQAEKALPYCEKAVKLNPKSAYKDSRGLAYGLLGDFESAIADFEAVIADLENSPDPELAAIAAQRAEWVAAMEAGENPFTPDQMASLRGEETTESTETTSSPLNGDSGEENKSAQGETDPYSLGQQHMSEGDFDAAISAFTQAIEMEPQNPDYYQARSNAYFMTGEHGKRMADLSQAINYGSQDGFVYFSRGFYSWMDGNTAQAISDLETALALGLPPDLQAQAEELLCLHKALSTNRKPGTMTEHCTRTARQYSSGNL